MGARRLYRAAVADLDTIRERDPSMRSRTEALLHPAVPAIWGYRAAHRMHRRGLRRTARLVSAITRVLSGGIEIHPGARIGRRFFIDHGTGVVIGETAVIGDDVTIFHQVTLGSVGWWHDQERPEGSRRHPAVGDRVVIGANATVLGAVTVGSDAVIGAQALVIKDVPDGARVLAPTAEPRRRRTERTARRPHPATTPAAPARRDHGAPTAFPTW
ncbi:serine O-acetyltransferase EpsC [Streptomyces harbinensis]|uniref:serine O-acetyltransferase EpsC n=1 Tax=Streptomyces harbinensis TaxID=1176198 RepID=UPI00339B8875